MSVELSPEKRSRAEYVTNLYFSDLQWIFSNKGLKPTVFHLGIILGAEVNLDENNPDGIPALILERLSPIARSVVRFTEEEYVREFTRGFYTQYSQWQSNRTVEEAFQDWLNTQKF